MLCVAVCVLWVRSYWVTDAIFWSQPKGYWQVSANRGAIWLYKDKVVADEANVVGPYGWEHRTWEPPVNDITAPDWRLAGFGYRHAESKDLGTTLDRWWAVYIPLWFVGMLMLGLPITWYRRFRRNRLRARVGRCPGRGYDLIPSPRPVIAILPDQRQQQQPTPRP